MTFPSPLAQPPRHAGAAVPPPDGVVALPVPGRRGRTVPLWVSFLLGVLAAGLVAYIVTFLGVIAPVIGMLLAVIPLTGVLLAVRIADRWEPEPFSVKAFAVAWGAVAAVAIALLVDVLLSVFASGVDPDAADVLSSVVQAPIVEEAAKGLGVLLIFRFVRRSFDGPVDGVVYGALVGAGFAFTENILYFSTALLDGGVEEVGFTFVLRGILSPFAHVMFTAVTGYMLGRAAREGRTPAQAIRPWLLGMAGAALLHALWNGSAVFSDFFTLYALLQVPLFCTFLFGVAMLRREEARLTRERLGEYAAAGWFTPPEVEMLATPSGRRRAVAWARTLPGDRSAQMRGFITEATALAAARQRAVTGRDPVARTDEQVYLQRAIGARAALLSGLSGATKNP